MDGFRDGASRWLRQRDGADEQKRDGAGAKIEKTSPLPPVVILRNKKYERSKYYFIAIFAAKYVYRFEQ